MGNVLIACWAVVGAFCGVALVASVSKRVPSFEARDAPAIIGSFVSEIAFSDDVDIQLIDSGSGGGYSILRHRFTICATEKCDP